MQNATEQLETEEPETDETHPLTSEQIEKPKKIVIIPLTDEQAAEVIESGRTSYADENGNKHELNFRVIREKHVSGSTVLQKCWGDSPSVDDTKTKFEKVWKDKEVSLSNTPAALINQLNNNTNTNTAANIDELYQHPSP